EEVGANAAIVEERVAFPRGAVTDDRFASSLRLDQERQEAALGVLDLFAEVCVRLDTVESRLHFPGKEPAHGIADKLRGIFGMASVDPQGAAMRGRLLDVENG